MDSIDPVLAFVVMVIVVAMLLWGVFDDDPASIYGEDDEPQHTGDDPDKCPACRALHDSDEPVDARAWRDPWGDT